MAKRVNNSFVTSVVCVMAIGIGLVAFGPKIKTFLFTAPTNTVVIKRLEEQADQLIARRMYSQARDVITDAWLRDRTNKEICVKRGEILAMLTEEEGQVVMDQARSAWESALQIDPRYKPAADRLLESYVDQMEIAPTIQVCMHLRETAVICLQIDPNDVRALAYLQIATIQQWVIGTPKTDQEIQRCIGVLQQLLDHDRSFADAMFYLVRAKTFAASAAYRDGRSDTASRLLVECRNSVQASTKAFPDVPLVNFRAFQCYALMADVERDDALANQDRAHADQFVRHAREVVDPKDTRYPDYQYVAADWAKRNGHPEESEQILRAYYNKFPNDQRARLALCRILAQSNNTAKRDEAIEILQKKIEITGTGGPKALGIRELEAQTRLDLASLWISVYPSLEPAKRPDLMKKIEEQRDRIDGLAQSGSIPLMRLKGLIEQLKGNNVEAVAILARAMTQLDSADPKNPIKWDLMYQLATAEKIAGQNHAAEKLLEQIVDRFSGYIPAHGDLAELYLQENNTADAAREIDFLARQMKPGNANVLRLQILLAEKSNNPDEARKLYAQLPESTFEQRMTKAQAASGLHDYSEEIRLMELMLQERPRDSGLVVSLVQVYSRAGQRAKGLAVLADAVKKYPKDERLQTYQTEINSAKTGGPLDIIDPVITTGDPFFTKIQEGRAAAARGDLARALELADSANKNRVDDPSAWDLYLRIYLREQDWNLAERAVEKLSALNADHADGRMYQWSLAMARSQFPEAIGIAHGLTVMRENFGQSWVLLGQAQQANGNFTEALESFQAAQERQTTNIEMYIGMADCYRALSQNGQALDAVRRGRVLFPDNIQLREMELAYLTESDPKAVVPLRQAILDKNPSDPENFIALAMACMRAGRQFAALNPKTAMQYNEQARDVLTKGVGKFPEHLRLNAALADALRSANQAQDGVTVLQLLGQTPAWKGKPDPLILLSEYFSRLRQPDLAVKAMQDAWARTGNKDIDIELQLARLLEDQHKYDDALTLLKAHQDDPRIIKQTLQTHIAANHTAEARKGIAQALRNTPDNPDLLNLLTLIDIDGFQYPEARETAAHVLKIDPRNDVATFYQAMIELHDPVEGDLPLAMHDLSVVTTRNPRKIQYRLEYANALSRIHDMEGAGVQLAEALRLDPLNSTTRLRLLDVYQQTGNWQAFETVVNYAELNPAISGPVWARSHAYALAAQGKYSNAIDKIREAVAMAPQNTSLVRDYLVILLQSSNAEEVINETQRMIDLGAHDWWIYHMRGMARFIKGKKVEALELLDKAMAAADETKNPDAYQQVLDSMAQISPDEAIRRLEGRLNDNRWRIQSVMLHMRKSDFAAGLALVQPLLDKRASLSRSDRITVIRFAAECNQFGGHPQAALPLYLEWDKEAPNDPTLLNNLAYLLADYLDRPQEGLKYSQRAYDLGRKLNMQDPLVVDTQGWVLILCGGESANEGMSILSGLVDSHPEFMDARYHLSMGYIKRGRAEDGARQLKILIDQMKAMEKKGTPVRAQLKADIQAAFEKVKQYAPV